MNGNPINFVDPDGDIAWFVPVLIGAGIGGISGGVQDGWGGALKGALIGGGTAWAAGGVGSLLGHGVGSFGTELARAGMHGAISGISSELQGGSFGSGFLSGAISSGAGSALHNAGDFLQYAGSAASGGFSSSLSGGNFWMGAGQGLTIAALNHNGGCPDCPTATGPDVTITPNAYDAASIVASTTGALSSFVGDQHVRGNTYLGKNGNFQNMRTQGWNQYTGTQAHMNRMTSVGSAATWTTRGVAGIGYASNIEGLVNGRLTGGQFAIESISTTIGLTPAPLSVPWTIGYEGIGRNILGRTRWYQNRLRPWVRRNVWGIID